MYHFGINIYFKTKNVLCLNIIFYRFYKIIWTTVTNSYLFTYLFNFYVLGSAHIFFVLITYEIALQDCMLLSFFSYNPVILYITLLTENAKKYVQYILSYFCHYFIFSRSRKRNVPVSKRVDVSRPSIYMN